jgi:hypothetical protein
MIHQQYGLSLTCKENTKAQRFRRSRAANSSFSEGAKKNDEFDVLKDHKGISV